jgi:hypothetical protein
MHMHSISESIMTDFVLNLYVHKPNVSIDFGRSSFFTGPVLAGRPSRLSNVSVWFVGCLHFLCHYSVAWELAAPAHMVPHSRSTSMRFDQRFLRATYLLILQIAHP